MSFYNDVKQTVKSLGVSDIIATSVATAYMFMWNRTEKPLPPGPLKLPFVGNLLQMSGNEKLYIKLNKFRSYGDIVFLTVGSMKMLVLYGHDAVKKVLVDRAEEFQYRPDWLVEIQSLRLFNGMVWSNGESNTTVRHFAAPALYPGVGDLTVEQRVQEEAEVLVERVQASGRKNLDLRAIFNDGVFNINSSVIFGKRYAYDDPEFVELTAVIRRLLQSGGTDNPRNIFRFLQVLLPVDQKTISSKAALKEFGEFIHKKVEADKQTFVDGNVRSLVDLFIKDEKSEGIMTEERLVHVIRDLFVAGSENVAFSLMWLIAYMIKYPDVQTRLRKSIKSADLTEGTPIGFDDASKLVFLQATINEVLRLANIAPMSVPHATKDEVKLDEYVIPKDTMVLTHLVSVHMDPKYYEEPEEFRPDRFIGQDGSILSPAAFYPYSIGPRYCVADKLAKLDLFIVFGELMRKFEFKTPEGARPPTMVGLQPGAFLQPELFEVVAVAGT